MFLFNCQDVQSFSLWKTIVLKLVSSGTDSFSLDFGCFFTHFLKGCPIMTAWRVVCTSEEKINKKQSGKVTDKINVGVLKWCHWETSQINQQKISQTLNSKYSIDDEILGLWFSDDMSPELLVFQNFIFLFVVDVQ